MQKTQQVVVRLETALVAEIDQMVHRARKRQRLGTDSSYGTRRPTRSELIRRLLVRALERDQRERAHQKHLPL